MWNETPKIGFAPTRRNAFSREDAALYRDRIREKISPWADIVDIDDINAEGLLYDNDCEADAIIRKFQNANVDAVFVPHCNFGTENTVARVAKGVGKPVLLWGPMDEDPMPDGSRLRDTQCGLFATGKVLRRFHVPFTYLTNCRVDDPYFASRFAAFGATSMAVKAFRSLRILQIDTRPSDFWTMICNEGELLERFGIEVFPITLEDVRRTIADIESENGDELRETQRMLTDTMTLVDVTDEHVRRVAALKMAMSKLAKDNGCSAIAVQCWHAMQNVIGVMPCLANGLLTDEGIPVTCETDIHGAITAIMTQAASQRPGFFADLTVRHTGNPNGELLFHCGNFPPSLIKEGCKPAFRRHFLFDDHAPGTQESEIRGGRVTIARFDGDQGDYQLFLGQADGISGKFTRGTYIWIETDCWPRWEHKLVTGPYVHHCVGVHGEWMPVLYETCKYINGLTPDPVNGTAELADWWMGI